MSRQKSPGQVLAIVCACQGLCPLLLHGAKVTSKMCWSCLIPPCIRSQSSAPKLAVICVSLPRLATKLMLFWMLEENFSLLSKSLNNWGFGCKSINCTRFTVVFFFFSVIAWLFIFPIGTGTIYSRGGPSLQLINLSLACGLKRDTMPLSKARLAQKPMQNHHQILLEVEKIS